MICKVLSLIPCEIKISSCWSLSLPDLISIAGQVVVPPGLFLFLLFAPIFVILSVYQLYTYFVDPIFGLKRQIKVQNVLPNVLPTVSFFYYLYVIKSINYGKRKGSTKSKKDQ